MVSAMKTAILVDKAGRMVLPKEFRTRLHLRGGDLLEAELGVDEIRLRRIVATPSRIVREDGRAVWDAPGASASVDELEQALHRGRDERDIRASGLSP
jgi:AbrB family looped-hinge helix DNA binding protein